MAGVFYSPWNGGAILYPNPLHPIPAVAIAKLKATAARTPLGQLIRRIAQGVHRVALGRSAGELVLTGETSLTGRTFGQ